MVRSDVPAENVDLVRKAYLSDQVSQSQPHIASQLRLAALRYENKVIVETVHRVRNLTVAFHRQIVPQAS